MELTTLTTTAIAILQYCNIAILQYSSTGRSNIVQKIYRYHYRIVKAEISLRCYKFYRLSFISLAARARQVDY